MKLPGSEEMKAIDRCAIEEFGIPGVVLMENAGTGTVRLIEEQFGPLAGSFALIFIGPGNNGGDGLVIGRHLHQRGCEPIFFFLVNPDSLSGDAAVNLAVVEKLRLPLHVIDSPTRVKTIPVLFKQIESRGKPCCAIIDAIFGTGLSRNITGHFADTIDLINGRSFARHTPVIAVDTPSGLDSDTGKIFGKCVKASLTATFGCAKPGQVMQGSSAYTGTLSIIDIGIPPEVITKAGINTSMITGETASSWLQALKRQANTHKGTYGHLLVLAGSAGKTGAAILTARGAQYSGCGLVSLCVPYDLNTIFETSLVEAMTVPLPTSSSLLNVSDLPTVIKNLEHKTAVVIGPGLGTDARTADLVLYLYHSVKQPLVVDADALNILAKQADQLKTPAGPRILTPHPGEMARLIGVSGDSVQENRLEAAKECYRRFKRKGRDLVIILKGAGTLVIADNDQVMINTSGNPGMAAGGMGDVLSGMIGSLLCQGLNPTVAAAAAVFLHGRAGDELYARIGQGFSATELARNIPHCLQTLLRENV
ncbi:NAD(P)H-hydrate dehydratase [Desulfofustis limnaeus]|jgi:NAD(P)H-hydrate epimerase|uniref:Bifunctional NAD(P)H-hydrate repair enzyme n=1 Tax=Desulfofustis limnaeus TaxID=2740163 RepID=A0ABM7W825_9BACT|nr:NAD(P)H-hydrate dehydratase [Desulfofustis limnaeus]MDX9894500.1 NAD(P)H-hydrate dehydratase [Desulfofustis sp.]BDD87132.1 bifunctional NAD(P)H-hydrate repair enzyme Nnr [Desulfofustis limnaeus]